jgi:hypothetical protein
MVLLRLWKPYPSFYACNFKLISGLQMALSLLHRKLHRPQPYLVENEFNFIFAANKRTPCKSICVGQTLNFRRPYAPATCRLPAP